MKKKQGFILVAVLIFLQMFTLLGLAALERVILAEKINTDQKSRRLLWNEAASLLPRIVASLNEAGLACLMPVLSVNQLRSRPLSWWADFSCVGQGPQFRFYYVVENLGPDPCAQLKTAAPALAGYYRITLLILKEHDERTKMMLQGTVVKEFSGYERCASEPHSVDLGAQGWREI